MPHTALAMALCLGELQKHVHQRPGGTCHLESGPLPPHASSLASRALNLEEFVSQEGWEETLDYIRRVFKEQGPFDGIFGFSQGSL